eukprot:CAMPEP_0196776414 /NCGR_PEP_ID=MMETSP1104-20130614/4613_1 /TAXON_ID=33652 /ORGANISM="Cafeteria sp., Strain Caron Lab Isolate" /LENGTH=852 /DNA_ID=CAMNT_0042146585 /DNA_START=20 /DNA_END=2578 /DNA_ORIENTATION=-
MAGRVPLRVLYDFTARQSDECSLREGQIVVGLIQQEGWWKGEVNGKVGIFPANYVEVAEDSAGAEADVKDVQLVESRSSHAGGTPRGAAKARGRKAKVASTRVESPPSGKAVDTLKFGLWTRNMAVLTGLSLIFGGPFAMRWADATSSIPQDEVEDIVRSRSVMWVGVLGMLSGFLIFPLEYRYGLYRKPDWRWVERRVPLRAMLYTLLAIPMFLAVPTVFSGGFLLCTAVGDAIATRKGELFDDLGRKPAAQKKWSVLEDERMKATSGWCARLCVLWQIKREQGELGKLLVLGTYLAVSFVLWVEAFARWNKHVQDEQANPARSTKSLSDWAPWAKACGQLLNFNCALIALPVVRSVIKFFHNRSISSNSSWANVIPLHKNVVFHKLVAKAVAVFTVGHIVAHLANFAIKPRQSLDEFGVEPWVSGSFITLAMFFIYSAADDRVRRAHYEIFWFNHHWFIVFWLCLYPHGPAWWIWFMLPGLLYLAERIFRVRRGNQTIYIRTVKWIPPVMEIQIQPDQQFRFKEGMYVYLNCPHISANEWHPFTLSSSAGDLERDKYISVHIKVFKGGWTDKLKQYFEQMNPRREYPLVLRRHDERGAVVIGKNIGVDGKPLLKLDGPHAAPSQHYDDYPTSMVVGAGIGMTPAASILRAILKYKWKKGFEPNRLFFYWVCRHEEVESFQWFVAKLTGLLNEVAHARRSGSLKDDQFVEIHVYVTRFDESKASQMQLLESDLTAQEARLPIEETFSIAQVWAHMTRPMVSSKAHTQVMASPQQAANRLGDMFVWNGRPDWDQVFQHVRALEQAARPGARLRNIGCAFCGASVIGKDLKVMCRKYSSLEENVLFHLHKENF